MAKEPRRKVAIRVILTKTHGFQPSKLVASRCQRCYEERYAPVHVMPKVTLGMNWGKPYWDMVKLYRWPYVRPSVIRKGPATNGD